LQGTSALSLDVAEHVALDAPDAVGRLLDVLREAGAQEQASALAARAVAHAALDNPYALAQLLDVLREAGAQDQAAVLAACAAAHATLDNPPRVNLLSIAKRSMVESGTGSGVSPPEDQLPRGRGTT
jgi:hypothetical protein